tara:strand:- start:15037 stop:15219 length:183 start_codon:yes stop_codon:yes gene_type:complete
MLNITPFIEAQKERAKAMKELSDILGMDFTFSDDEIMKFALEDYGKAIKKEIDKAVSNLG